MPSSTAATKPRNAQPAVTSHMGGRATHTQEGERDYCLVDPQGTNTRSHTQQQRFRSWVSPSGVTHTRARSPHTMSSAPVQLHLAGVRRRAIRRRRRKGDLPAQKPLDNLQRQEDEVERKAEREAAQQLSAEANGGEQKADDLRNARHGKRSLSCSACGQQQQRLHFHSSTRGSEAATAAASPPPRFILSNQWS